MPRYARNDGFCLQPPTSTANTASTSVIASRAAAWQSIFRATGTKEITSPCMQANLSLQPRVFLNAQRPSVMLNLVSQTRKAMQSELYYVALISALSIPDIAGALEAKDRRASKSHYVDWYEKWVRPRLAETRSRDNPFSGEACYIFRCSMVHQGASHRSDSPYKKIIFIEPGYPNYSIHYCLVGGNALLIQIDQFIEEVLRGCELWLESVKDTEPFVTNYGHFAKRHPQGVAPYVIGVPVVG